MVNFDYGRLTAQALGALTSKHAFKSYPGMGHSSCQEVIIILYYLALYNTLLFYLVKNIVVSFILSCICYCPFKYLASTFA